MASLNWANGVSGNWDDAADWYQAYVPTSADDVGVSAVGIYTVSVTHADVANSLTFNAASATLSEQSAGSLSIAGALELDAGTLILRAANTIGSVNLLGGLVEAYNGKALGGGTVTLQGAELTGMANETFNNYLSIGGSGVTLDAATGTTVNYGGGDWYLDATGTPTIQFGSATRKGTVVWNTPYALISVASFFVDVAGGTLRAADSYFGFLLGNDTSTTIDAGAKIDLDGFSATVDNLLGAGDIADTGGPSALILKGADFSGVISGAIGVEIAATATFSGANAYTGGTTIDSGQTLSLNGHGALKGAVIDNGELYDADSSGTVTLGPISGAGLIELLGGGSLVLENADSYSGGTNIFGGKVLVGNGKALGAGGVTISNAGLIGTANETVANAMTFQNAVTIAAATGTSLTLSGYTSWNAGGAPLNLTFGAAGDEGTVISKDEVGASVDSANPIHVRIAYGTLEIEDVVFGVLTGFATDVKVSAGATVNLDGHTLYAPSLTSAGAITNSATSVAVLKTEGVSSISGALSGKIKLDVVSGTLTLSGADTSASGATIESGATLQLGIGHANGGLLGAIDDEGAFIVDESGAVALSGVISGAGTLTQKGTGSTTLSGANTYTGGTVIERGELIVTNAKALGTGAVTLMNGAELLATNTLNLGATQTGVLTASGVTTIAAAHGKTLTIGGGDVDLEAGTMEFGAGADDGTVVFKVTGGAVAAPFAIKVNAGTLKAGDPIFPGLVAAATSVTVASSATLNLGGFSTTFEKLLGGGAVTSSGGVAQLTDVGGTFGGAISGAIALIAGNVTLSGHNTYTGGTTIAGGDTLQLGAGGATGSIVGKIADGGNLAVDESGAAILDGVISGAGAVTQKGTGATTLSAVNSYTGGTTIQHGELIATKSSALGAGGAITMTGGELLASATQSQTHALDLSGSVTLAAAHGVTLTLATSAFTVGAGHTYFGEGTNDGTVVLKDSGALSVGSPAATYVEVRVGTLKEGDTSLSGWLEQAAGTRIDSGATLDAGGHTLAVNNLSGPGVVTNSGAASVLAFLSSTGTTLFGGAITGKWTEVEVYENATLGGAESFTGKFVVEGGALTFNGTAAESIDFNGSGLLILPTTVRFTGKIEDFGSGTTIDLENVTAGAGATLSYVAGTHVLTISDGTHTDTLTFAGAYAIGNFVASDDGSGGTDVTWQMAPPAAPRSATAAAAPLVTAMASFGAPAAAGEAAGPKPAPSHSLLVAPHGG